MTDGGDLSSSSELDDGDHWVEVRGLDFLADDLAPGSSFPASFEGLIVDLITEAPNSAEIVLKGLDLEPPPGTSQILLHESALPRTRIYVNFGKLKTVWIDAAVALAVALSTGGAPAAPLLVGVISGLRRVQVLSEDEAEVVHVLLGYDGLNPYVTPIPLERIRGSYEDASVDIDALLRALQKREVISVFDSGVLLNR